MSSNARTPNHIEGLSAQDTVTGKQLYLTGTTTGGSFNLNVNGGSGGGGAVTIANGADTNAGSTTDAAVTAGSAGTISGKLRQISADISTSNTLMATSANQTNGNQLAKITDGTNNANVLKSDGTAAGQNSLQVSGSRMELASLTAGSLNADLVPSTDVSNYRWVSVQLLSSAYSGTLSFQGSNDNTNFIGIGLNNATNSGGSSSPVATSTTATNQMWQGNIPYRYFRIRMTSYVSGTAQGIAEFFTIPASQSVIAAGVYPTSATGSAIPANAFPIGVSDGTNLISARSGKGDASTPTGVLNILAMLKNASTYDEPRGYAGATAGTTTGIQATAVVGGLMPIGTKLNTTANHITTNATTTLTASLAYISSISISNEVGGTTSTITVQDKSGTPLKLVNGVATTALTTTPTIINFQTPVLMTGGIDVITAGAVAATVDIWVNYYQ